MNKLAAIFFASVLVCSISACDNDPEIPNEGEVITDLVFTLTPQSGGTAVVLNFADADGDGGNAPVITVDDLAANTTYAGAITIGGLADGEEEDITVEIAEEDEEHQFFFSSSLSDLVVAYNDTDADGNPVGLSTTVETGEAGSGTLTVTLRHEPAKDAAGVAEGDITNAGGETDIEVIFNVTVK